LVEWSVTIRTDQSERQERTGLGEVGRPLMERDRSGIPSGRILWSRCQPVLTHHHIPPESDVRHIVSDGVRSNLGFPIVPPSVRTLGYHNWRPDERLSSIPCSTQYFCIRIFHANSGHEPSYPQEIR